MISSLLTFSPVLSSLIIRHKTWSSISSFDRKAACEELGAIYSVSFMISENTPIGTQIPFNMEITDESDGRWSDSFSVDVK